MNILLFLLLSCKGSSERTTNFKDSAKIENRHETIKESLFLKTWNECEKIKEDLVEPSLKNPKSLYNIAVTDNVKIRNLNSEFKRGLLKKVYVCPISSKSQKATGSVKGSISVILNKDDMLYSSYIEEKDRYIDNGIFLAVRRALKFYSNKDVDKIEFLAYNISLDKSEIYIYIKGRQPRERDKFINFGFANSTALKPNKVKSLFEINRIKDFLEKFIWENTSYTKQVPIFKGANVEIVENREV